ncbi:MAG: hypothetical protein Q4E64_06935 [Phascolarctobacterium sp.]|uniref:hypothetical protein n=1 Tax=Phascolarctobacterium sp. TaxID=2049039 RepID=UPI0026DACED7|nr:hypothetical protein [Phascolarctobacterium sp.]MDO4921544.1 hypothetical protein [Phascolarctobacterium sp.]
MYRDCLESDWKLFRKRIGGWQEAYMGRLLQEYIQLLNAHEKAASEKFWELNARIKKDKRHPGVLIDLRRSSMVYDIAVLVNDGAITVVDLDGFSDELKDKVKNLTRRV